MGFQNLAGVQGCDAVISLELHKANIPRLDVPTSPHSEVPYTVIGKLGRWTFTRSWNYWCARATEGKGLPQSAATKLNETWFSEIRVAGMSGGDDVDRWLSSKKTIDTYDIDTQEGLTELARVIQSLGD